jgi:hypothetical protein
MCVTYNGTEITPELINLVTEKVAALRVDAICDFFTRFMHLCAWLITDDVNADSGENGSNK